MFCIYPSVVRGFVDNLAQILQELGTHRLKLNVELLFVNQFWVVGGTSRRGRPLGLCFALHHCV